ncbi:glycerol kinase [Haloferax mediterranei ATCC 33500]|uniref:Glycerol kinase n=1 Tax=Haloferax mediterranei (strain ATCC 33500 / DSM 1411 / JCM 8866 / NBRC 14739 / NCIMB 2177 / R-4) TaxID=523841 RepID=I3R4Z8_HALMT|nr:glycerol kinase GlpK [Haloferax mediterranei]AFK19308.1 glycerol kinase [Haloferax mediterranei ATCC 33500]AHZ21335.1 glycerol kinase [Haloferax mediterranei ATCC 33500]EMA04503.1 glycerol kinase [Haloferax mediterranei ATCC 33500]MDX5989412.1 glycerol kinase GlpK [Haloferax mediterranei ATCC 33500]QCQ75776.1 glycerol kinase [Haloferax mediterranei ATCC 33500]
MSGETYVGAIDQGTTGTRFMVFDHDGKVVANAYEKHEQIYPEPGWVEHDANEIWENTKTVINEALNDALLDPEQLEAIGITNQRETTIVWDRETGQPIHNAIVWQDRRTTDRIETLEADGKTDEVRAKTGLEPDAYFSATKAEWILDNSDPIKLQRSRPEDIRDRAAEGELAFGTIDTWLIYKLTGNHITDVTNASRTMLFNIHDMEWDDELLDEFNVPREILPEVRPSSDDDHYGETDASGFLGAEVPVAGALGDQQAALFGQTCFDAGDAKNTYGTGSFMLMNTGEEAVMSEHGLLTTVGFQRSGEPVQYALEGSIFITGAAIEWLEDMTLIENASESEKLARSVDSTDGVYFVPAFAGLGAPHWDQRARGTIVGMTRGTRREHIVRATLESIAFQTRDVAEAMESDSGIDLSSLRVDGGAVKNNFLCQLQSNILDTEIVRPQVDETTALGAAYAAGLAVGYWETMEELRANWQVDREFGPSDPQNVEHRYGRWKEAVDRSLDWARDTEE